jgi:hypothetical protein
MKGLLQIFLISSNGFRLLIENPILILVGICIGVIGYFLKKYFSKN